MQNVRLSKAQSDNTGNPSYYTGPDYIGPLVMKQHALRLTKFSSQKTDEWDKSSKTASTYHSNFQSVDNKSEFSAQIAADTDIDFNELVQQQRELLELQNNVQKSLLMIQKKLKDSQKLDKKKGKQAGCNKRPSYGSIPTTLHQKPDLYRTSSVILNPANNKTPERQGEFPIKPLTKSKSGIGLSEYKDRSQNSKSFIGRSSAFVDYSEVINDCGTNFTRVVITPNKADVGNTSMSQIHNSMRRSRGMRSNLSSTKDAKSISYTPKKIFKVNESQPQSNNTSAYINFHPTANKRSHTPLAYRKPKPASNKQYGGSSNKSSAAKPKIENTSGIVYENLRLRLHKASRGVTLKHLSNLCNRSTPEIRHVMLSF